MAKRCKKKDFPATTYLVFWCYFQVWLAWIGWQCRRFSLDGTSFESHAAMGELRTRNCHKSILYKINVLSETLYAISSVFRCLFVVVYCCPSRSEWVAKYNTKLYADNQTDLLYIRTEYDGTSYFRSGVIATKASKMPSSTLSWISWQRCNPGSQNFTPLLMIDFLTNSLHETSLATSIWQQVEIEFFRFRDQNVTIMIIVLAKYCLQAVAVSVDGTSFEWHAMYAAILKLRRQRFA